MGVGKIIIIWGEMFPFFKGIADVFEGYFCFHNFI